MIIIRIYRSLPYLRMWLVKKIIKIARRWLNPVDWKNLRSLKPVSDRYGLDRGKSVDRYYIEKFIKSHQRYIRGKCLEICDKNYTLRFGGQKVIKADILDINRKNPNATIYSDLRNAANIKSNSYDCIILTQVLPYIDDLHPAVKEIYRILKPQGIVMVTAPSFCRIDVAAGIRNDYWRFTPASLRYLFEPIFGKQNIMIYSFGNVLTGLAFWEGISLEELHKDELNFVDPNFPIVVCLTAIKPGGGKIKKP